jgi:putative nucleotidyltransferase with HDIG domain
MKMLDHIAAHSIQVCRVATLLADHLGYAAQPGRRSLIRAAALLHDITKTRSFETRENHAATGAQFLAERGYPEVARIVGQHVRLDAYPGSGTPGEAEIVNYADKRVLHDRIATLQERMSYILHKYGRENVNRQRILWLWEKTEHVERRIFSTLSFAPGDLAERLNADGLAREFAAYNRICHQLRNTQD